MTSCTDGLAGAFSFDLGTGRLDAVFTEGLTPRGYPELMIRLPPDESRDDSAHAVFFTAALVTLGHALLRLDPSHEPVAVPAHTALLVDEPVTVWIEGPADLTVPRPRKLLVADLYLVGCSLWDRPPG